MDWQSYHLNFTFFYGRHEPPFVVFDALAHLYNENGMAQQMTLKRSYEISALQLSRVESLIAQAGGRYSEVP